MKNEKEKMLQQGIATAFIDDCIASNLAYKPQFISNNYKEGRKVISSIEDEFFACDEFSISVAFITMGGLTPLLQTLKKLEKKGIRGRILTTDYLCFSEPKAIQTLASLKNITVKMYITDGQDEGFHTKGYIFRRKEFYRIIVGSSNMTMNALTTNREWNTKLVSTCKGEYLKDILAEFEELWNSEKTFDYAQFIEDYSNLYLKNKIIRKQKEIAKRSLIPSFEAYKLQPNSMQVGFIANLKKIYEAGERQALLISATGTGKTYASAFAMREIGFSRVLFLVHRNQIAKQAKKSFERVFGNTITTGMVTGEYHDFKADYIFATVQTLSKTDILRKFSEDYFDACIYDEAHHACSASYKRVMDYFRPKFMLGMTATPDKRDDHMEDRNVYEIFNHNIAYEIRLKQAMEENLLCPFHYFGITDMITNLGEDTIKEEKLEDFRYLTSDDRVTYVMEQAAYYGYSGERVKGLIFCSRIDEARELSQKFNEKGLRTMALSGNDSEKIREHAIERLIMDVPAEILHSGQAEMKDSLKEYDYLDYIITVDIFSEGTDIVEINQIIMLRPTQSPIVFIQQLGRGLRKAEGKDYVVVLDFIGNYKNNFMIPIALSGDRSYNKDNIRHYLMEGGRIIPGASTIHFDEISKKRIFSAIDNANFSDIKLIKENYLNLRNKLGRIPKLNEFDDYGEMDVLRIFDNKSLGSYYQFLVKYEKDFKVRLNESEAKAIEFISKKFANGKRIHELELLKRMLLYRQGLLRQLIPLLEHEYGKSMNQLQQTNVVNVMTNTFLTGANKKVFDQCVFLESDGDDYKVSHSFAQMLDNPEFCEILEELIEFGIGRYRRDYSLTYKNTDLVLYQKYTYEDVCRLLNWENNEVPLNIGGYRYDKRTKTFPIFINYDKEENISESTKYEDHFVSANKFIAISKSGRSLSSEDVQNFLHAKERDIQVELFVRKNKDDKISKEFYYLGHVEATGEAREFVMAGTNKTAVEIEWILDTPVREDIYEYIVHG